ncbi:MAG TPA: hypothetical protein VIJ72_07710, partial [Rhizomicrobium sp.]
RRIGEPQVRAYISIKTAALDFLNNWPPGDASPRLTIVATNSGQSPARNFVWRPQVEYIGGNQRRLRDMGGNWVGAPGASIASGDSFQESALIPDLLIIRFANSNRPPVDRVMIRIRVEFAYTDVFDKRIEDKIYFVGLTNPLGADPRPDIWRVEISPEANLRDWGDVGPFENQ